MALIASRKHTLHDHLVGAPIPNPKDRGAKENSGPREVGIRNGLNHVEVVGRHHRAKMGQATDAHQSNHSQRDCSGNENEGLYRVRVDDCSQAACDSVRAGSNYQDDGGLPQRPARNALQNHASCVKLHGNLGEDVSDDRDAGQIHGGLAVETTLEELRHGKDVATKVKRNKHPAQDQQNEASQPLKMSDRETGGCAGSGQADKVLGGNIGNEQGCADEEPSYVAAKDAPMKNHPTLRPARKYSSEVRSRRAKYMPIPKTSAK